MSSKCVKCHVISMKCNVMKCGVHDMKMSCHEMAQSAKQVPFPECLKTMCSGRTGKPTLQT